VARQRDKDDLAIEDDHALQIVAPDS
jgi:hypothetical protein